MDCLSSFSLKDKVSVVTGGYGHLGKGITEGLMEAGSKVIVAGRSNEKYKKIFDLKEYIFFIEMDVSSTNSINKALSQIYNNFGHIDILINNAFYLKGNSPEEMSDEEWNYGIDGTLNSVFRCIREAIPYMKKNDKGNIINISSMYGVLSPDFKIYETSPDFLNPPHYGSAKAGIIQLTKYYAVYLSRYNIRVNCISPGPFPSEDVQKDIEFIKKLSLKNPSGRIGTPEDLKGPVVFLASESSSYITGHNLIVDGGWTIW